jgi:FkbM family methyltransferase
VGRAPGDDWTGCLVTSTLQAMARVKPCALGFHGARLARGLKQWRRAPEVLACAKQVREWPNVTLAYLGLRQASYPFTVHFRNGDQVLVETYHDLVTVWVIFFRREYRVDAGSKVIVDAGANIGTFVLYAARKAPGSIIHALEPFPSTRDRLLQTLQSNGLGDRVRVYPIGLSGEDSIRFMPDEGPSQSRGTTRNAEGVAVPTRSLAHFFVEAELDTVDLLKMDIEGGEHEVLAATALDTLKVVRRLALEYHPGGSSRTLFAKLAAAGFRCSHDERVSEDSGVADFVRPN